VEPLLDKTKLKPIFKYISTKQANFRANYQGKAPNREMQNPSEIISVQEEADLW
jgi:hypothetical protein